MVRKVVTTFLACFITGCVTVTGQEMVSNFNPVMAADARIDLGLGYLAAGNRRKAIENLELAIKYAPNYYRSLNSIAYYYQLVGEYERADTVYRKAIRGSPENSSLLNNYGAFLCRMSQYDEADDLFNRAIKHTSNFQIADSLENAAICSLKSDKGLKAEHYFARSLDYEPGRYFALLQLSRLEYKRGEYNTARERLIGFHNMFGYRSGSLKTLIEIEEKSGNSALAKQYKERLDRIAPDLIRY